MDIVLAICIFVLTAATAYLGVHVSLHPPQTDSQKKHYKVGFGGLTLLAAIAIGYQTYLGRVATDHLQTQLDTIQRNTQQPPVVNVPAPIVTVNSAPQLLPKSKGFLAVEKVEFREQTLSAGNPFSVNLYVRNTGTDPVYNIHRIQHVLLEDAKGVASSSDSLIVDRKARAEFSKVLHGNKDYRIPVPQMGVGEGYWDTLGFQSLTDDQVKGIVNGDVRLYIFIHAQWDNQEKDTDICQWLQYTGGTQVTQWKPVWHNCG
jgi:hypothetical protein